MNISYLPKSYNFESEVLNSPVPVVVIFSAVWCVTCQTFKNALNELLKQFKESNKELKYKVIVVDIDEHPNITSDYNIRNIPTCIVFKDKEVKEVCNSSNPFDLIKLVNSYT